MTAADLVIEAFAADEVLLHERIRSLEEDCASYRALAQQALAAVYDLTIKRDQLGEQHQRLLDEYRHLRAQTMRQAA